MHSVASYLRYSSMETWYPHMWCRLKILGWRLHHAFSIWTFNIWTGSRYVCAHIRYIIMRVHPRTLHSLWINFLMKFTINSINMMSCMFLSILEWTLFITHLRLLFYFVFHPCLIFFRTIYRLQMALGV